MKKISIILLFVCMSCLISCNNQMGNAPETMDTWMRKLKNYVAEVDVVFTTNENTGTMKMKQVYEMDQSYRLTILEPSQMKGYETTWDGRKIEEYNPITDKKVQAQSNPVKNQVLFGTFVHNYLHVEHGQPAFTEDDKGLSVEVEIPGNYKYMAKERVWFDKKTKSPLKMVIYDKEGKETIHITFTSFQYNER
ncbi:MAG: hypothetical protein ACRDDX_01795 [Cellulosilyticaceae bacterium]